MQANALRLFTRASVKMMIETPKPRVTTIFWKGMSTSVQGKVKETVPPEDYYDGHLIADHLEYVDDMIEKMIDIEKSVESLKETHAKKRDTISKYSSTWSDADQVHALFEQAASENESLSRQINDLKGILAKAKNTSFAVDGPDGQPDGYEQELLTEVNHIVDEAAAHEDTKAVNYRHKMENAVHKDRARDPEHDW